MFINKIIILSIFSVMLILIINICLNILIGKKSNYNLYDKESIYYFWNRNNLVISYITYTIYTSLIILLY